MEQKKLLKTLETIVSKRFTSEKKLLFDVVQQLVEKEEIKITGGRVWQLNINKKAYKLIFQSGNVQKINPGFSISLDDYPIYKKLAEDRTVLADETDETLIKKGILRYSASGAGSKIKIDGIPYYEYFIALNSNKIDDELRYSLNIVATIITSKLNEQRIYKSQKNITADLNKAQQLQKSILPEHEISFNNYELFGVTLPAETLGGDFFDYVNIGSDNSRLGVLVGDAASKGISAAAEAMYISGAIRMASTFQIKIATLIYRLNNLINKIFSDDRFTTLFYGEISNDKRGLFLYSNAGHNPPIFVRKRSKRVIYLDPTGPLLGPAPNSRFETDSINFQKGDLLVIYSDGITEAANAKYKQFEEKRLERIILKNLNCSPRELTYKILDAVNKFSTDKSKYQDDKTIVVIKRKV
jgi:sigma-B regulation protein RsbU (phosphoserine phosphatase)